MFAFLRASIPSAATAALLAGCVAPPPPPPSPVASAPDPAAAYRQCSAEATAATAGVTFRRGAAEARLFNACMADKAPGDPAASQ